MTAYLLILLGLIGLFLGGSWLVKGSVSIAHKLAMPPLLIGLPVVGFGTSTPELLVSVDAALAGAPDIALGNVVGSNIFNILGILGLTAIIQLIPVAPRFLTFNLPLMLVVTIALAALLLKRPTIGRPVGAALLVAYAGYILAAQ